jgi:RNA polymerase sigma factor for flagellar operon FliA
MTQEYATSLDANEALRLHGRLVRRVAWTLKSRLPANVEIDDLTQVGMMGLIDAIERFDLDEGIPFEAFAVQRIRGAMLDELRSADWLSRSERKHRRSTEAAVCRLQHALGRTPLDSEVAAELGLSPERFRSQSRDALGAVVVHFDDLDAALADDPGAEPHHALRDDLSNPMSQLIDRRRREAVYRAIQRLPERQQRMLDLYYEQDKTFRENGDALGLSESGAFRLHRETIARLRQQLRGW